MDARERERVIEKYERVLSIGVRVKSLLLSNTNSRNDDDEEVSPNIDVFQATNTNTGAAVDDLIEGEIIDASFEDSKE